MWALSTCGEPNEIKNKTYRNQGKYPEKLPPFVVHRYTAGLVRGRKDGDGRPAPAVMDGWPCDTVDAKGKVTALAYCVASKCVRKLDRAGKPLDLDTIFVTVTGDHRAGRKVTGAEPRLHGGKWVRPLLRTRGIDVVV